MLAGVGTSGDTVAAPKGGVDVMAAAEEPGTLQSRISTFGF